MPASQRPLREGAARVDSGGHRLAGAGCRSGTGVLRRLHHTHRWRALSRRRRAAGAVLAADGQCRRHRRHRGDGHQSAAAEWRRTAGIQRFVHHQLRGAAAQAAQRCNRDRVRLDHHHPFGDERPAGDRRLPPRGPAPHALGLPVGDSGVHRLGARHRAPAAGTLRADSGQSGASADGERLLPGYHPADRARYRCADDQPGAASGR
ncbi:hypothetical protein D3C77_476100 [compost metagenome]